MSQDYNTIMLNVDDHGIATVTINRPKKLNALNSEVLDEVEVFDNEDLDETLNLIIQFSIQRLFKQVNSE